MFKQLAISMATNTKSPHGSPPADLTSKAFRVIPTPGPDGKPLFHNFGHVLKDVVPQYFRARRPTVSVEFVAGNPRNNVQSGGTFLIVEYREPSGQWKAVRTDDDYDTR